MSYGCRYLRVGLAVLVVHDFADIFLYTAKSLHYLKVKGGTDILFAIFAISFFASRNVFYPFYVLLPTA